MAIFTCRQFGFDWEHRLVALAIQKGHEARRAPKMLPYDAVINGYKVQCKRKDYQDPCGGVRVARGQKRYKSDDYDVLALNFRERLFFIPAAGLVMPSGTLATKVYLHKLLRYENYWSIFEGVGGAATDPQWMLF